MRSVTVPNHNWEFVTLSVHLPFVKYRMVNYNVDIFNTLIIIIYIIITRNYGEHFSCRPGYNKIAPWLC